MVLADPEMIGQIKETIRAKKTNAETALERSYRYVYRYL
jgi:phosphotransferase system enzyme I (PtsI)